MRLTVLRLPLQLVFPDWSIDFQHDQLQQSRDEEDLLKARQKLLLQPGANVILLFSSLIIKNVGHLLKKAFNFLNEISH
jgi:hypothetical protein